MKTILSLKAQDDRLTIVEDFTVESGKTKDLAKILEFCQRRTDRYRSQGRRRENQQAGRNILTLSFLSYNRLRAHDLYYGRKVLMLESAAKNLADFYGTNEGAE